MLARLAGTRCARAAAAIVFASGLLACASPPVPNRAPSEVLLEQFRSGRVRLDCERCRFDFRGTDWMLEDGHYEPLVLAILRSGDGSGRSWYLLGRAAEATGSPELAIRYYHESLATPRQPVVALLPLYEDVNFRMRRLLSQSPSAPAPVSRSESGSVETVIVEALVVGTRPGSVGAFLAKLHRGDRVEVLERSGDWEQLRLADGRVGWAWAEHTNESGEAPAPRRMAPKPATAKRSAKKAPSKARRVAPPAPEPPPLLAAPTLEPSAPTPERAPAPTVAPAPLRAAATPSAPLRATATPPAPVRAATPPPEPPAPPAPQRVDATRSAVAARLVASGSSGILGCPLPLGASLSGRSHGSEGSDDHPTETYAIEAPAHEIVGFYEREMERAGWHKTLVSSDFLLYFVKDDETLGVLIDREGGFFTLMGS